MFSRVHAAWLMVPVVVHGASAADAPKAPIQVQTPATNVVGVGAGESVVPAPVLGGVCVAPTTILISPDQVTRTRPLGTYEPIDPYTGARRDVLSGTMDRLGKLYAELPASWSTLPAGPGEPGGFVRDARGVPVLPPAPGASTPATSSPAASSTPAPAPAPTTATVPAPEPMPDPRLVAGDEALRDGKLASAAGSFEAYLQEHPQDVWVRRALGVTQLFSAQVPQGVENIARAYAEDPALISQPLPAEGVPGGIKALQSRLENVVVYAERVKTPAAWTAVLCLGQSAGPGSALKRWADKAATAGVAPEIVAGAR